MKCQYCGSELEQDSKFCAVCGNKVEQSTVKKNNNGSYCPYCGAYNDADDIFCANCGRDLLGDEEDEPAAGGKVNPVRYIIIVLAVVLLLAVVGGGTYFVLNNDWGQAEEEDEDDDKKTSDDGDSSVEEVMEYIDDIGEVDLDSEKAIGKARMAYEELTRKEQRKVENYDDLEAAEEALAELKDEQEAAEEVMDYIDAIGTVDENSEDDIQKAREAYDDLTSEQKKMVENYDDLEAAEEAFDKLKDEQSESLYILPESNQRALTSSDLSGLTLKELGLARNEIYARHGRTFKSQELQSYFDGKSWYKGTISPSSFSESLLSSVEKKNIEKIQAEEKSRGGAYSFK